MLNSTSIARRLAGLRSRALVVVLVATAAVGGCSSSSSSKEGSATPGNLCLDVQPVKVVPPAGLQVKFRVLDCDGNPVRPLTASDLEVINDEKGQPFGKGGEGDTLVKPWNLVVPERTLRRTWAEVA